MTTNRRKAKAPTQVTEHTRVGNLGCVRFPLPIRKASGIKRGDRLMATAGDASSIILSKVPADLLGTVLEVDECACQKKPEGCSVPKKYLEVGWSYVQFDSALAQELGLEPGTPLVLVAEPHRITLSVAGSLSPGEMEAIPSVRCPP